MKNSFPTKAVILAGGKGSRLYPITHEVPKPLLPVKRKPIINYLADFFYTQGIKEIAVLFNHSFKEDFIWWKKRYYPEKEIKFVEEKKPLGTFGGLYFLKDWIGKESFFMTNGDEIKELNLKNMHKAHQNNPSAVGTVALCKVPNPDDYGTVICDNGMIKKCLEKAEKPLSEYINSGLYLLSPAIFDYHPGPEFLMFEKDVFPKLAEKGKLAGFKFKGKWLDCGTWDRYQRAINLPF